MIIKISLNGVGELKVDLRTWDDNGEVTEYNIGEYGFSITEKLNLVNDIIIWFKEAK